MRFEIQSALIGSLKPAALDLYRKRFYWRAVRLNYQHIVAVALGQLTQCEALRAGLRGLDQCYGRQCRKQSQNGQPEDERLQEYGI